MVQNMRLGNRRHHGFSLMELMVVLVLIALLASVVTPIVTKSIKRAEESTLKENLFILRRSIDDYYTDKGKYPESLELLTDEKYIRKIPGDPTLDAEVDWNLILSDGENGEVGIIDIKSKSSEISLDGTTYDKW